MVHIVVAGDTTNPAPPPSVFWREKFSLAVTRTVKILVLFYTVLSQPTKERHHHAAASCQQYYTLSPSPRVIQTPIWPLHLVVRQ